MTMALSVSSTASSNSTPSCYSPAGSSMGPGRIRPLVADTSSSSSWRRQGLYAEQQDVESLPPPRKQQWKISEMVNPDGSVTVRKRVVHPDGTRDILEEEYASLDRRILSNRGNRMNPDGDSGLSSEKTRPINTSSVSSLESSYNRSLFTVGNSNISSSNSVSSRNNTRGMMLYPENSDQSTSTSSSAFSTPRKRFDAAMGRKRTMKTTNLTTALPRPQSSRLQPRASQDYEYNYRSNGLERHVDLSTDDDEGAGNDDDAESQNYHYQLPKNYYNDDTRNVSSTRNRMEAFRKAKKALRERTRSQTNEENSSDNGDKSNDDTKRISSGEISLPSLDHDSPDDDDGNDMEGINRSTVMMYRPENPVPFEAPQSPIPSVQTTWIGDDDELDVSAMSGDSMGYPMLDTSSVLQEEEADPSASNSNTDDEWSLLQEEEQEGKATNKSNRASSALSWGRSVRAVGSTGQQQRKPTNEQRDPASGGSKIQQPQQLDPSNARVVMQHAPVLEKPKPKIRFYKDPGVDAMRGQQRNVNGLHEEREDFQTLRHYGPLFDQQSSIHTNDEGSGVVDVASPKYEQQEDIVFTVRKTSITEKMGLFVGTRLIDGRPRLVVTKVSPNGKFAESPIAVGDVVVSINGINFLRYPNSEEALQIVRQATGRITFVIQKVNDPASGGRDGGGSIEELSLPSLPYHHVKETVHSDESKIVTREIGNNDGSQTTVQEYFDPTGKKQKQITTRQWVMFDGSKRDISTVSLDVQGDLAITVTKATKDDIVGLRLQVRKTHRGQSALVVAQVFPSGLFARTPLSVDDTILSINGVNFQQVPDLSRASKLLGNAQGEIDIRAMKSLEWIQSKKRRLCQARQLVETFTIPAPRSQSFEFDDASYGGSMLGYRPAKRLTLKNFSASESVGIAIQSQSTQWGTLLVATTIDPSSRLDSMGLDEGDVILSINGIDFREEPDAGRAMQLIRNSAENNIEMEYQKVEDEEITSTAAESQGGHVQTSESFKPDGTKCIRTESRNPDGSIFVKIEEITCDNPVDVTVEEPVESVMNPSDMSDITGWDVMSLQNAFREPSLGSQQAPSQKKNSFVSGSSPLVPVSVTVKRTSLSQSIGISLTVSAGVMYVEEISPTGLLVGKPILPGDTVLSINGVSFRTNPSVVEAMAVLENPSAIITFRILKTSLIGEVGRRQGKAKKKPLLQRLCCSKNGKRVDNYMDARQSAS